MNSNLVAKRWLSHLLLRAQQAGQPKQFTSCQWAPRRPSLTCQRPPTFPFFSHLVPYHLQRGDLKTSNLIHLEAALAPRPPVAGALCLAAPCFNSSFLVPCAFPLAHEDPLLLLLDSDSDNQSGMLAMTSIGRLHLEGRHPPALPRPRHHPRASSLVHRERPPCLARSALAACAAFAADAPRHP